MDPRLQEPTIKCFLGTGGARGLQGWRLEEDGDPLSLLYQDQGQQIWGQPLWGRAPGDVPCHQDRGTWLRTCPPGAAAGSQGSGEGFYSNCCHSLPISDVNERGFY